MLSLKTKIIYTAFFVLIGTIGGLVAKVVGLPLPFMLGALIATSLVTIFVPRAIPEGYQTPSDFRAMFIGLIGLSIGAKVDWVVLAELRHAWASFLALTVFVPLVLAGNYIIFRKLGRYDPATSYFCSTPGGLIEAMLMGEEEGAVEHLVTLQQFLRIIFVVTMLPVGLSLWYGHPVGSAGGMSLSRADAGFEHLPEVALLVVAGFLLGKYAPLPAGQLVGPLLVGAAATLSGLFVIEMPGWMLSAAQVVVGSFLGTRFHGIRLRLIVRGAWLAFLSVTMMLVVGLGFAWAAHGPTGEALDVLLISFSPGGVTEMALIALSLNANPAFVSAHHIYRILLTVGMMRPFYKRFVKARPGPD
ncbi:AbrB family transcriptional regulator [Pseudooceanicola sp. LIPI14-2-Ac024]|uniref:AbrB family transcriptional regulator n=1 Tax=Pseudooceanicola sp. LIPI14-2-Ac024 TaxID=3344875 RepID=UPI0035CEF96C